MSQSTRNTRILNAPAEKIYKALTSPGALETWQAPGDMTGKVHKFDLREGGGYGMSLFYPQDETEMTGKTAAREDRFTVKFIELKYPEKIVQTVVFHTDDPKFSGEMAMEITFEPQENATNVMFSFRDIPIGIRPEDNETGTKSSLEKLAMYVEN